MANKVTIEFKKGDNVTHFFKLPVANYSAGGTLSFVAKPSVDNDATDATAVIDKDFSDSVVVVDSVWATWTLAFVPADIVGVNFTNGEKKKKYLGEFVFTTSGGAKTSFPADDEFIDVIIYADIKRG